MRDKPNAKSELLLKLEPWAELKFYGEEQNNKNRSWVYIHYGKRKGWVYAKYVCHVVPGINYPDGP